MNVIYWLLDSDDNVLYVGMTVDLRRRMNRHARTQPWWPLVASLAHTDEITDVYDAAELEVRDIVTLRPAFNQHHRLVRRRPVPWRTEQERLEIEASYLVGIFGERPVAS